ncbi:MAG: Lrp/AsnC family transcriptional regulator [Oscillospiraceae bacterium]|jgi:Lrp/AsnC family leucine-responsive transcriptional regulator|nr:Lrp/AsnC family transcriptional regulator [Oscillospiraceae bacterium]
MDLIDYKILTCLKANARQKASAISEQINLSVSSVIERIKKMEANGIIEDYTVILNNKALGNDVTALMEVSLEHPKYFEAFTQMVQNEASIISCYYLTGEFDFVLKIITDSSDNLELIHRRIKSMEGVSATKTHFVLKNIKNDYSSISLPEGNKILKK